MPTLIDRSFNNKGPLFEKKMGSKSSKAKKERDLSVANLKFDWKSAIVPISLVGALLVAVCAAWAIRTFVVKKKSKDRLAIVRDFSPGVDPGESIFVSVPAYRETEVASTVCDLFAKARCPFRVYVGVCSQIDPDSDPSFWREYESVAKEDNPSLGPMKDHVRVFEIDHREAKGPAYARAMIEHELYRGEKYYMTIDAHTKMAQDWDVLAIACLKACPSDKPMLTCCAGEADASGDLRALSLYHFGSLTGALVREKIDGRELPDEVAKNEIAKQGGMVPVGTEPLDKPFPKNCLPSFSRFSRFDHDACDMPVFEGALCASRPNKPIPALFWSANFSFSYGENRVDEVPFDPELEQVFFGEEIAMSIRLFTHGYDMFHPTGMFAYQRWTRDRRRGLYWDLFDESKFGPEFVRERERERLDGYRRIKSLMGLNVYVEDDYDEYPEAEEDDGRIFGVAYDDESERESKKGSKSSEGTVRSKVRNPLPRVDLGPYGLGSVRTFEEYQAYCGLDLRNSMATARAFCGVTRDPSRNEVVAKYGGETAYRRRMRDYQVKRKWKPKRKHRQ